MFVRVEHGRVVVSAGSVGASVASVDDAVVAAGDSLVVAPVAVDGSAPEQPARSPPARRGAPPRREALRIGFVVVLVESRSVTVWRPYRRDLGQPKI